MIDAILHIAGAPATLAWFAGHAPDRLGAGGRGVTGFAPAPTVTNGTAAPTWVRVTPRG